MLTLESAFLPDSVGADGTFTSASMQRRCTVVS